MRSRYTLNSDLFGGLCTSLASITSSYLQNVAAAQEKGLDCLFQKYAAYCVLVGKHAGQPLGSLGRKIIYGYAFLTSKREQCVEALRHLSVLLEEDPADDAARQAAEAHRMSFGPHRKRRLGTMRVTTWRRLKAVAERELSRADAYDELRAAAQAYLRYTPPHFPGSHSDGLSTQRRQAMHAEHLALVELFGALPDPDDEADLLNHLTDHERSLFAQLEHAAYADTKPPTFVPLRWNRAGGCVRHRDCALIYDPVKRRYLFLAYLLHATSRHRRPLQVRGTLYDVNNPELPLRMSAQPTIAMLFELEFDTFQQRVLDQARADAPRWKTEGKRSGAVRSATLHAHYDKHHKQWWFEVQLAIGIKLTHVRVPEHVVGVHVDRLQGWFVSVLRLDGTVVYQWPP